MTNPSNPLRVGIGGPVGSGKTALCEMLCKKMRDDYDMAVITNDIYTKEDMEILLRADALPSERLMGVETGGCPHTAIREDASINLEAIARLSADFPNLDLKFLQSAGIGFRYSTPIGPLRLDIGVPIHRRKKIDPAFQIYFSIGQAF